MRAALVRRIRFATLVMTLDAEVLVRAGRTDREAQLRMMFGDSIPPAWVRPFAWGSDPAGPLFERDRFLSLAKRVVERRGVQYDEQTQAWLAACWNAGAGGDGV